jgi:hypothetical protein
MGPSLGALYAIGEGMGFGEDGICDGVIHIR